MTRAARLAVAAILFAVVVVSILTLAAMGGCLRAQQSHKGESHEAPRVTPGPVAGSAGSRTLESFGTDAARRMTPSRAVTSGPIGFDTKRESEAIVQAVSVRFEQPANPNRKRQRDLRSSPRGLNGAECARISSSASVSTPTRDRPRHPASAVLNSAGGGGPKAPGYGNDCRPSQRTDYARERTSEATFVDLGSIPSGSTLDNQQTEIKWNIRNQASAESFTTTQALAKKNRGQLSSRKCTAIFASTLPVSTTAALSSANPAPRTAKSPASRAVGVGHRGSEAMAEELGPIDWWVWLLADPKQRKTVNAATRMLALRKGVLALGVPVDRLDAEVARS
jgi:hypothetical protein